MADLIIYGGTIITMDDSKTGKHDSNSSTESIAIKDGIIVAIGSKDQVLKSAGDKTCYVQLQDNQTLLPGLIEPHSHAIQQALTKCLYTICSAYYYHSYNEIKALFNKTIAAACSAGNKWCIFFGWDPEIINDLPQLNLDVLDSFSTDVAILVTGQSGHTFWVNRQAYELAGILEDVVDPVGGHFVRDSVTGKLTGQMLEYAAVRMVLPENPNGLSEESTSSALDQQWNEYSSAGLTTVTDLVYMVNDALESLVLKKSQSADCPMRLALYQQGNQQDNEVFQENDKLWFAGVKLFADGSPHCGTAAIRGEYLHNELTQNLGFPAPPNSGIENYKPEELLKKVRYWHEKGKQIAIHAHGERAIEQCLDALEEVLRDSPIKDHRHRLEHVGLCEEKHIKKATELGVALSFFVQHLYFYATTYKENILGPERTNRWAPLSLAVKHKNLWTIHQDHPTFPGPPQPFANMMTAVTRTERYKPDTVYGPEYCITIEEALKGYTINAAKQIHKEKELGSLTVGKRADLVILSENPLTVDPFKLVNIKVLDTYLDGRSNRITERKEEWMDGKLVYSY